MIDFIQIHTFTLIVEKGSMAQAAKELRVSPAAISKQLSRLENSLGVQLITRTTRHIELTDIGAQYFRQCQRILEEVDEAHSLISQLRKTPKGPLKVVSGRHFAMSYIIPYVKEFLLLYPEIDLTLELAERVPSLSLESIDIVIGMSVSQTGDTIQKKIGSTRYCFCAAPKYLQEFGVPLSPQDLLQHRYITHSMRKPDDELVFSNKEQISITPYLRINDAEAMLDLACNGIGIVKLHEYVVIDAIQKGLLVEVLPSYTQEKVPIFVAYPPHRYIPSKVRCFINFIEKKLI